MKRIIVMLAIVAMGSIANAASLIWGCSAYSNGTTFTTVTGTAWLISLSSDSTTGISVNTQGTLSLGTGDTVFASYTFDGGSESFTSSSSFTEDNVGYYAVVVYDSVTQQYGISYTTNITTDDFNSFDDSGLARVRFYNDDSDPNDPYLVTDTAAVVVPEPTVLALLALGVAGLALRRKTVA